MTNETMHKVREVEEDVSTDVNLGSVFETSEKLDQLNVIDKAQKLEHEERKLRLEEAKQKLEAEKFEYQKEQNKKDNRVKLWVAGLTSAGTIIVGVVKGVQVYLMRKYTKENYQIEGFSSIMSPTARGFAKEGTNPRI